MTNGQTSFSRVPQKADGVTARDLLREATRSAHARVEALLRLASPELTLPEYAKILRRFWDVYAVLEQQIEVHTQSLDHVGLVWQARRKLPLIQRDLAALGEPLPVNLSPPPCLRNAPLVDTFASAMGCLYVLEGATLGGKIISHNLQKVLQIRQNNGAAFFNSYGPDVQANWRDFCVALEHSLNEATARQQAVDAAIATFNLFGHLADNGDESYVS